MPVTVNQHGQLVEVSITPASPVVNLHFVGHFPVTNMFITDAMCITNLYITRATCVTSMYVAVVWPGAATRMVSLDELIRAWQRTQRAGAHASSSSRA